MAIFTVVMIMTSLAVGALQSRAATEVEGEELQTVVDNLSTDVNRLTAQQSADVERLTSKLNALQDELNAERRQSAFLAQFSATTITASAATPLLYDHVVFNDGNNYDPAHGIFTAPFSGVYVFFVKTFTGEHETQRPAMDLVRNGQTVERMAYDYVSSQAGHGGDSHSMGASLRLAQGDRVWVQLVKGWSADQFYGTIHTSFSAALVYSD